MRRRATRHLPQPSVGAQRPTESRQRRSPEESSVLFSPSNVFASWISVHSHWFWKTILIRRRRLSFSLARTPSQRPIALPSGATASVFYSPQSVMKDPYSCVTCAGGMQRMFRKLPGAGGSIIAPRFPFKNFHHSATAFQPHPSRKRSRLPPPLNRS